jgi:SAM-dependent methyltransferase
MAQMESDTAGNPNAAASDAYVVGGTLTEQQRLLVQCQDLAPAARDLLDRIRVMPGWQVIDVGCGPLGIVDLLSERVGPAGHVVGLEREARFVDMGRALAAERALTNVEIVQGDATATELPAGTFDLVHERLVLPGAERVLTEMARLVRPGGFVALQDMDGASWLCYPPHPSWDTLVRLIDTICQLAGIDRFIGRRLPTLLREAGLVDVNVLVTTHRRGQLISLIESARQLILARALTAEDELDAHVESVRRHLSNPNTFEIPELLVQAWARKP